MDVTPDQIRAARALLRLEQAELARRARVSLATLRRIEGGAGAARVTPASIAAVRTALERTGAEFIQDGVRRRPVRPGADALYRKLRAISLRAAVRQTAETLTEADLYDDDGLPG